MIKLTKNLYVYDCFKKWSEFNVAWVFSDPHFEDTDCKLIDPNWPTPEEQIKLINSKVGKRDLLFILGDIGNVEWVKKLKGYKVLVMGNHDKGASNYRKTKTKELIKWTKFSKWGEIKEYREVDNYLFDEVYEGPVFINEKILLSHEPIKLQFGFNIHGHDHSGVRKTTYANETTLFNVASNVVNYEPQRLDKLIEGADCTDIHRLAIDKQIKKKSKKENNI